jgi:hypothetical protein
MKINTCFLLVKKEVRSSQIPYNRNPVNIQLVVAGTTKQQLTAYCVMVEEKKGKKVKNSVSDFVT